MSVGSEATNQQAVDDSSNDALVIVDDSHYPPGLWNFMAKEISFVLKIQTWVSQGKLEFTIFYNYYKLLFHSCTCKLIQLPQQVKEEREVDPKDRQVCRGDRGGEVVSENP